MKRIIRVIAVACLPVFPSISFSSLLDDEASALRAKCIANIEAIKTIKFASVTRIEPSVQSMKVLSPAMTNSGAAVSWDKRGRKVKWKQSGAAISAYSIDAKNGTFSYIGPGSASVFKESIAESDAAEKAVPSPRWLWNPTWLIPEKASSARLEGNLLVIATSNSNPKREIKLERETGHLAGFVDTDAKGKIVRVVEVSGWTEQGGVWLPDVVREEIRTVKGPLVRSTSISVSAVNTELGDADFVLP